MSIRMRMVEGIDGEGRIFYDIRPSIKPNGRNDSISPGHHNRTRQEREVNRTSVKVRGRVANPQNCRPK